MARLGFSMMVSLAVAVLAWSALGQDDFSLEDAFDDVPTQKPKPATKPPKGPPPGFGPSDDLDLSDYFDATKPPKVVPKRPSKPDVFNPTRKPRGSTAKPPKKTDFKDSDLDDVFGGGYKPDKGKGGSPGGRGSAGGNSDHENYDNGNLAETGTIAGIVSALVMALVGAVSSYISYQQKKFCFSIQQGLNAEYVKGENMEAVVTEEPQVKYSSLEPQSAVTPPGDPSKV
ncbi:CD99 antigen-like protein 2 isoform X3 [Eleutherodactylus coqui]|uniref:CD99 antigen-like protein 2 isoform X3 n=1 Tax=Eleutherodactylus coqui TaxID=57060 RepID=UPI0034622885